MGWLRFTGPLVRSPVLDLDPNQQFDAAIAYLHNSSQRPTAGAQSESSRVPACSAVAESYPEATNMVAGNDTREEC